MKSIIEELWYGNVVPSEQCEALDEESKKILGQIVHYQDELLPTLTEKQKEILESLDEGYSNLAEINERKVFVYAFRLGVEIAT